MYDWDRVGSAESLGAGIIDLTQIEPFEQTEMRIALVSAKHGQQGSIRVRMTFQPAIIVKARKVSEALLSIFNSTLWTEAT